MKFPPPSLATLYSYNAFIVKGSIEEIIQILTDVESEPYSRYDPDDPVVELHIEEGFFRVEDVNQPV
jgi:hypothetical protein